MEEKKSLGKELQEKLTFTQPHIADEQPDAVAEAERFCVDYKAFLDAAKTEREAAAEVERRALAAGYRPMQRTGVTYKTGDKVFYNNRGKAMLLATLGKRPLDEGVRLMVAHIDSPRLDLKPNPLYEDSDIALFKTHYYGGIRKYQWGATPLSLHGVVYRKDGTKVEVRLGEEAGDPVFCVTDLLPHLGAEQNKRTLADGLRGEELNIVVGSLPYADKELKERVKLYTLTLLNEKYGITERDFTRAELEAVPAVKASDVGFDRSMIGAYGHDDRVCAYTALQAELGVKEPEYTTVCILADKEEVGSDGPTGLVSDFVFHFLGYLADAQGANYKLMLQNAKCLSADVNAAFDPTFPDVFEKRNSALLNGGVCVTKYTGSRGKSGTSDASAEFAGEIRSGYIDVSIVPEELGFAVNVGELLMTECEMVNGFIDPPDEPPHFMRGYGLVFGMSERKAMAMELVDRALQAPEYGEHATGPAQDEEFVLAHADNVEAAGFVSHLKLPHYVDFQAELELLKRLQQEQNHG